jgi:glycerol-3-phosphate acyltransferase PlsY
VLKYMRGWLEFGSVNGLASLGEDEGQESSGSAQQTSVARSVGRQAGAKL